MIRLIVEVIGEDPDSGEGVVLFSQEGDTYDVDSLETLFPRALREALESQGLQSPNELRRFNVGLVVGLTTIGRITEVRPAIHLSAETVRIMEEAGASFDFDPYVRIPNKRRRLRRRLGQARSPHDAAAFNLGITIGLAEFHAKSNNPIERPLVRKFMDESGALACALRSAVPILSSTAPHFESLRTEVCAPSAENAELWGEKISALRISYASLIEAGGTRRLSLAFSLGLALANLEGSTSGGGGAPAMELAYRAVDDAMKVVDEINKVGHLHFHPVALRNIREIMKQGRPMSEVMAAVQFLRLGFGETFKLAPLED